MKYIFINQAARFMFIDIVNVFAKKGRTVELVTGEVRESNRKLEKGIKVRKFIEYKSKTAFQRLFTWLIFTSQSFFYLLFHARKDTLLVLVTTPPFLPFLGLVMNKLFKVPYCVIVYDVYPEVLLNMKILNRNSLILRIWRKWNQALYRKARKVMTIGEGMAHQIRNYDFEKEKLLVVPNWVDSDFIRPLPKEKNWFVKAENLSGKFVVLYSGNMGATHDLETLIDSANQLKDEIDILFLVIGEGIKKQSLLKKAGNLNLQNITFLPLQPSDVLPYSLTCGDLAYVTLGDGAEFASVPSKFFYMLAAGNGIISVSPERSDIAILTKKYSCGRNFKPGNVSSIVNFILYCYRNGDYLREIKHNARIASFDFTPVNADLFYSNITSNA